MWSHTAVTSAEKAKYQSVWALSVSSRARASSAKSTNRQEIARPIATTVMPSPIQPSSTMEPSGKPRWR